MQLMQNFMDSIEKMERIGQTIRKLVKRYKFKESHELCTTILFLPCIFTTLSMLKLETQFFLFVKRHIFNCDNAQLVDQKHNKTKNKVSL